MRDREAPDAGPQKYPYFVIREKEKHNICGNGPLYSPGGGSVAGNDEFGYTKRCIRGLSFKEDERTCGGQDQAGLSPYFAMFAKYKDIACG